LDTVRENTGNTGSENTGYTVLEFNGALAYVLEDEAFDDAAQFRIMQNTASEDTVRCISERRNGKKEYFYLTGGLEKLSEAAGTMRSGDFITAVQGILAVFHHIRETGFLTTANLDLRADRIFLEPGSGKVRLIYLPLKMPLPGAETDTEKILKQEISRLIGNIPALRVSDDMEFLERYLGSGLTAEEYLRYCGTQKGRNEDQGTGIRKPGMSLPKDTASPVLPSVPAAGQLRIICESDPKTVFTVDKAVFVIGKKSSEVDGAVTVSSRISRVHCRILQQDGGWYAKDLNSMNGTFINGIRLSSGEPAVLRDGDTLKLADVRFHIEIH